MMWMLSDSFWLPFTHQRLSVSHSVLMFMTHWQIIPAEPCGSNPPVLVEQNILQEGQLIYTQGKIKWQECGHKRFAHHTLSILAAVSCYNLVEVLSYRSRGGAAGFVLGHGSLIHRQTLFHRHRFGLLVLGAQGPLLRSSRLGSICAACSYTHTNTQHIHRGQVRRFYKSLLRFDEDICIVISKPWRGRRQTHAQCSSVTKQWFMILHVSQLIPADSQLEETIDFYIWLFCATKHH